MNSVSFVIPTYCGGTRLSKLFAAWPSDAIDERYELLVFSDGSPGPYVTEIEDAIKEAPEGLKTTLLRNDENRGIIACVRDAIEASSGNIVMQLDDDITLPRTLVPTMLHWHRHILNVGVLSWRSMGTGPGQSKDSVMGLLEPATELASYCMSFTRGVYNKVGGFDPRFRVYCGDSDFALRVTLAGHPCYRVWYPLVPHEEHASFRGDEGRRGEIAAYDLAKFHAKWKKSGSEMQVEALDKLRRCETEIRKP